MKTEEGKKDVEIFEGDVVRKNLFSFCSQPTRTSLCNKLDTNTQSVSPWYKESFKIFACKETLKLHMIYCQAQSEGFHSD